MVLAFMAPTLGEVLFLREVLLCLLIGDTAFGVYLTFLALGRVESALA